MGMKSEIMYVHILGFDLDKLIVGPIQEVSDKHLLFILVVDSPGKEFNLFLDRFVRGNHDDVSIRVEDFGDGGDFDLGQKSRHVGDGKSG